MIYLLAGFAILGLVLLAARQFINANPAELARGLKLTGGLFLLGLAAVFALTGRVVLAFPAAGAGLSLLGLSHRMGGSWGGGSRPKAGQVSRVRTALLEMELDHDSGAMRGQVLAGAFEDRSLDSLDPADLKRLWREAASDPQSLALVEAYLDRRLASWRVDFEADGAQRHGSPAGPGAMTDQEAYEILGLSRDAGDAEVRAAHRRLMKRLHPDSGGTAFLAAKLNEAKDRLLRRHD